MMFLTHVLVLGTTSTAMILAEASVFSLLDSSDCHNSLLPCLFLSNPSHKVARGIFYRKIINQNEPLLDFKPFSDPALRKKSKALYLPYKPWSNLAPSLLCSLVFLLSPLIDHTSATQAFLQLFE